MITVLCVLEIASGNTLWAHTHDSATFDFFAYPAELFNIFREQFLAVDEGLLPDLARIFQLEHKLADLGRDAPHRDLLSLRIQSHHLDAKQEAMLVKGHRR